MLTNSINNTSGGRRAHSVTAIATHYELLGVSASATQSEIRNAYRSLARTHHPDQRVATGPTPRLSMSELNEAYRVLRDPVLRLRYDSDERLRGSSAAGATGNRPASAPAYASMPVVDATPARYPWKLVAGMAAVGVAVVIAGAAFYEPADPMPPDNVLREGSCVSIEPNNDAREVNCDAEDDLVVREMVPMDGTCRLGLAAHRDRQGMGIACVSAEPA